MFVYFTNMAFSYVPISVWEFEILLLDLKRFIRKLLGYITLMPEMIMTEEYVDPGYDGSVQLTVRTNK